ncbi:glycosyltransferase family 4 protein [Ferrimicrobium sp.]|uniref:glycosyltransferase family 4 protein n=1 Tax=Ferrimicrobium sp. TaxID=2926050 RepID=UPI00263478DD|nr:glycosyltransferase family 4 protein [Ferrimicrobium sp.]
MKVVEISPYDLGSVGGVQAQVSGLAQALRSLQCEVEILAPGNGEGVGASLGSVSRWRANGSVAPVTLFPRMNQISGVLEWADVIHLHEPFAPMAGVAILRWAYTHDALGRLWVTFHRDGVSAGYRRWAQWWAYLLPRSDHQIAVSPFAARTAEIVAGVYPQQIPNGVALGDNLTHTQEECELSDGSAVGRSFAEYRVLFVGRHEERKGLEVALQALTSLEMAVRLIVVGSGPLTGALQARYPDRRVDWLGRVDQATLTTLYRSVDVVVAPSLAGESFGVVLLEAMANGAVVIASDIPAYRWLSRQGSSAVLVPPRDADALAMALHNVLTHPEFRDSLRRRAFEQVRSFAFDALAERYLQLFLAP